MTIQLSPLKNQRPLRRRQPDPLVVSGKKYDPRLRHAECLCGHREMNTIARRRFRAAVYAVMAHQKLQTLSAYKELEKDPMYKYQYAYEEPVYEWEDVTVPPLSNKNKKPFQREVSLTIDDVFASDDDYLRKVAKLRYGPDKVRRKRLFQDAVMAVLAAQELSRALDENIHPRNKHRILEYAVAAQPNVNQVLKSQELYHKVHLQLEMRQKLRAAVYAIMAIHRLQKRVQAAKDIAALMRCHHCAMLEARVKKNLTWLSSHVPRPLPSHPRSNDARVEEHEISKDTANNHHENDSSTNSESGVVKLAWAVTKLLKTSE